MKKNIFLIALAIVVPFFASAQVDVEKIPSINISISCDTLVAPDRFTLTITIVDNKGAGKVGIDNVEKKTLVPTLKAIGIDVKRDLVVSNFYSNYDKKGNTVSCKNYTLSLNSINKVNEVTKKLSSEDILVAVTGIDVSNSDDIIRVLRIKALKQSKAEAAQMLSAADCSVGRLLKVSSNVRFGYSEDVMMKAEYSTRGIKGNAADESVGAFRKKNLNVYINVTYEIINK